MKSRTFLALPIAVLALLLSACSSLDLLNGVVPTAGFTRSAAVAYGTHARQQLDVYQPRAESTQARPVVLFFYGGSWESGRRADYMFVAEALTSKGFIVVVPDYRLYPEVRFPTFVEDAALAFRWTRDHAARFGGDPGRIFVMGHSAGAHQAAMLTFDERFLAAVGARPTDIKGMIGLAGPYDFLPLKSEALKIIFGPEAGRAASQPINFVDGTEAPVLLFHGDDDTVVGPHNSANLARRIVERGGRAELVRYPNRGHIALVVALAAPFRAGDGVLDRIAAFVSGGR